MLLWEYTKQNQNYKIHVTNQSIIVNGVYFPKHILSTSHGHKHLQNRI